MDGVSLERQGAEVADHRVSLLAIRFCKAFYIALFIAPFESVRAQNISQTEYVGSMALQAETRSG